MLFSDAKCQELNNIDTNFYQYCERYEIILKPMPLTRAHPVHTLFDASFLGLNTWGQAGGVR